MRSLAILLALCLTAAVAAPTPACVNPALASHALPPGANLGDCVVDTNTPNRYPIELASVIQATQSGVITALRFTDCGA
jgi:hypothetical protein